MPSSTLSQHGSKPFLSFSPDAVTYERQREALEELRRVSAKAKSSLALRIIEAAFPEEPPEAGVVTGEEVIAAAAAAAAADAAAAAAAQERREASAAASTASAGGHVRRIETNLLRTALTTANILPGVSVLASAPRGAETSTTGAGTPASRAIPAASAGEAAASAEALSLPVIGRASKAMLRSASAAGLLQGEISGLMARGFRMSPSLPSVYSKRRSIGTAPSSLSARGTSPDVLRRGHLLLT